jgi:hypothetical protein
MSGLTSSRVERLATRAGVAVAAVLGVVGVAHAAIPGGDGRIKGCYEADPAGTGGVLKDLYVVDDRDSCPAGTSELTWSQGGPTGATGPTGPSGPQGASEVGHGSYRTDVRFVKGEVDLDYRVGGWASAECRPDETAIAGGGEISQPLGNKNRYALAASIPAGHEHRWQVRVARTDDLVPYKQFYKPLWVDVWAVCARTVVVANPAQPSATEKKFGPRP